MISPYRTFLLVAFLDQLSIFFILPYLDIHAKQLGFNYFQIGLIGAIFPACQMISSPIVGSLSDVRGRRPIFLACLIICSIVYFCLGITSSLLVFIILRIVTGTFKHTLTLTRAMAPDYIDDKNDVTVLYGKLKSLAGIGLALGPILSGYIMEAFPENGFNIMCTILSGVIILNAALINALPDIAKKKYEESEPALEATKLLDAIVKTFNQTIKNFYNIDWTIFGDIFLYLFLMSVSMGLYFNNFRLFLNVKYEASPSVTGYISSIQGIITSITNEKISFFNKLYARDLDYSLRIFHVFLVMVLALIGLATVPTIPFYIAILIPTSIYFAMGRIVALIVVSNKSVSSNRGTLLGAFSSVSSLGGIIAPIIGGVINQYLSVTYVFYISAMIASIGLVLSYRARAISLQEKTK
ncbi:hypothetical protein PYW08_001750 [Mythimna loreyi]|uniref:Uncharacterized protein n=1 Tax=Mythimna loreyi TaxID=667449 RepID=A0ACC2R718_9NEOP|nr:hypothetical protein PYW08_001750 [Mythimna loreyi]